MTRLLSFKQWPILPKIMTISVVSISVASLLQALVFAPEMERRLMATKKEGVKNAVDVAFTTFADLDALVRAGQLTLPDAQARAARKLGSLRYGESEYFWINDLETRIVMHPIKPELDGKDQSGTRDPAGKYLFREFVKVARASGAGFVEYLWPKPGEADSVPKVSYVRLYEPWGWVLGSGIYVDDVRREMSWIRWILISCNVLFTVVTLAFAAAVGAGITRPLRRVIEGLKDIATGKGDTVLANRIAITSIDEIGVLSTEFNGLMEAIGNLSVFKKVIEEDESVEDVYGRLGEVFTGTLGMGETYLYEVGSSQGKLLPVYPAVPPERPRCDARVFDNAELCKAKRTGHTVSSLTYPGICRHFQGGAGEEHACIPLVVGGGAVGVAQFVLGGDERRAVARQYEGRLHRVEQYLREALPVIETKRLMSTLREASLRDPMTGLHNRRYLQEYTEKIVAGTLRRGKKVGLVMCDLDYFKQVNDTHGHAAGDAVLRETAAVIARSVRASDVVVRFGGEEFLVVLLDVNEGEAVAVAEKIRDRVQATKIRVPGDGVLSKTISLGIAEFPTDTDTFWHCIKFADVALYKAKEAGRNRAVRFTADMWSHEQF